MRSPMPSAVGFRCKERIKNLFRELRRDPHAGVTDRNKNPLILSSLRPDDHLTYPIHVLHRFNAVDDQIHHDLLQLHAISNDLR